MIAFDLEKLTPEARDGVACCLCGRSFLDAVPVPSQPIAAAAGGQIFACVACVQAEAENALATAAHRTEAAIAAARPFWLTGPCPPWCVADHHDQDAEGDRLHSGAYRTLALTTMPAENHGEPSKPVWRPVELLVDLSMEYREREPRVLIGSTADGASTAYLTLAEAERLAAELLALVEIARADR